MTLQSWVTPNKKNTRPRAFYIIMKLHNSLIHIILASKFSAREDNMPDKKFVFILKHSVDQPDQAAAALQLAANMKAFDVELDFFLLNEGAMLAKKGFAETITGQKKNGFSPISQLLKTLIEDFGVKFYVCASCVKPYGLEGVEFIPNAEIKPGSFLGELLMERQNVSF